MSMHVHTRLYTYVRLGRPATLPLLALAPPPQAHILSIPLEQYVIGAAAAQANAHARTRSGRQEIACSLGRECVPLAGFGEIWRDPSPVSATRLEQQPVCSEIEHARKR
jgi:hypothetical protein